jgi:hypothetical protein
MDAALADLYALDPRHAVALGARVETDSNDLATGAERAAYLRGLHAAMSAASLESNHSRVPPTTPSTRCASARAPRRTLARRSSEPVSMREPTCGKILPPRPEPATSPPLPEAASARVASPPLMANDSSPESATSPTFVSAGRTRAPALPVHPCIEQTRSEPSSPAYDGWSSPQWVELPGVLLRELLMPSAAPLAPSHFEPTRFVLLAAYEACFGSHCALQTLHEELRADPTPQAAAHGFSRAHATAPVMPPRGEVLASSTSVLQSQFASLLPTTRERCMVDLFWRLVGVHPSKARRMVRGITDSDMCAEAAFVHRRARVNAPRVPSQSLRRWLCAPPDCIDHGIAGVDALRLVRGSDVAPTSHGRDRLRSLLHTPHSGGGRASAQRTQQSGVPRGVPPAAPYLDLQGAIAPRPARATGDGAGQQRKARPASDAPPSQPAGDSRPLRLTTERLFGL